MARRASGAVRQLPSGNSQARLWSEQTGTYATLGTFASKRDADAALRVAQTDKARSGSPTGLTSALVPLSSTGGS